MHSRFHRIYRTHKSDPKAERCFYLNRGRNHPRDCVKMVTDCGRTRNSRDVTWEMERRPIIEAAPEARKDSVPTPWDVDLHVRYLPPKPATVPPGMPPLMTPAPPEVPPQPPGKPLQAGMPPVMTPAPPEVPPPPPGGMLLTSPPGAENPQFEDAEGPPGNELLQSGWMRAMTRATTTAPPQAGMPPAITPAPQETPPPPGVMSPSSPPGAGNPQGEDDEAPPDNELLQPGWTRARTWAYHQASTTARPTDHALINYRPPNQPVPALPTCGAGQPSEPATYQEAMLSPYHANWSHAMEKEFAGLEEAGTFGDA